jgi:hypothetical protein
MSLKVLKLPEKSFTRRLFSHNLPNSWKRVILFFEVLYATHLHSGLPPDGQDLLQIDLRVLVYFQCTSWALLRSLEDGQFLQGPNLSRIKTIFPIQE